MENRQLGGFGFLIANAAMFANGLIAHRYGNTPMARNAGIGRMTSAGLWSVNASILAKYGSQPVPEQQARLEHKLAAYLHKAGVPLSVEELKQADAETQRGWFHTLEGFLYDHPIECGNAYYAVASTGYGVSGYLRHKDGNRKEGLANLGVTALSMTGALASILIPERTPEQIKKQGQEGTLWGKIQQHPLGYVRWIFLGVDALAGLEAVGEFRSARKLPKGEPYRPWQLTMAGLSIAAMGAAVVSDWLTSGSKKASGEPAVRDAAQQALETAAAQHLATLPPAQRAELAMATASYLVKQHELRFSDRDPVQVAKEILQKVEAAVAQHGVAAVGAHTQRLAAALPVEGRGA